MNVFTAKNRQKNAKKEPNFNYRKTEKFDRLLNCSYEN